MAAFTKIEVSPAQTCKLLQGSCLDFIDVALKTRQIVLKSLEIEQKALHQGRIFLNASL